ncbi:MAG: hypothetical protein PF505_09670, partial [Vallitaleaceae bacterium]|nr:hypothetical protein [Vallitaleaceae bacterium]
MTTKDRASLIDRLLLDEYSIEYAEPAIVNNPGIIYIDKSDSFKGEFGIKNMGLGSFFGVVTSLAAYITIEDTYFDYTQREVECDYYNIRYTIDTSLLETNGSYTADINIVYLGGEITLPLHIRVKELVALEAVTGRVPTVTFEANKINYHHTEKGYFTIHSTYDGPVTIRITGQDTALKYETDTYTINEYGTIPFKFYVSHDDIMHGITPINFMPEHTLFTTMHISFGEEKSIQTLPISITNYNLISTRVSIDSKAVFHQKLKETYNLYVDNLLLDPGRECLEQIY